MQYMYSRYHKAALQQNKGERITTVSTAQTSTPLESLGHIGVASGPSYTGVHVLYMITYLDTLKTRQGSTRAPSLPDTLEPDIP